MNKDPKRRRIEGIDSAHTKEDATKESVTKESSARTVELGSDSVSTIFDLNREFKRGVKRPGGDRNFEAERALIKIKATDDFEFVTKNCPSRTSLREISKEAEFYKVVHTEFYREPIPSYISWVDIDVPISKWEEKEYKNQLDLICVNAKEPRIRFYVRILQGDIDQLFSNIFAVEIQKKSVVLDTNETVFRLESTIRNIKHVELKTFGDYFIKFASLKLEGTQQVVKSIVSSLTNYDNYKDKSDAEKAEIVFEKSAIASLSRVREIVFKSTASNISSKAQYQKLLDDYYGSGLST